MAYMKDNTGRRLDAMQVVAADDQPARAANPLMAKLRRGKESCLLQVIGDSTGDGVTRWPYLLAQKLATAFPAYNVDYFYWNDATKLYDALGAGNSSRIQTGTGMSPATVVDTMVRSDSAVGPGVTTDANAYAWLNVFGTHGITSNKMVPLSDNAVVSMQGQYADHTGTITLSAAGNSTQRLYLRFRDQTNTIQAQITVSGTSGANLVVYKTIGGVNTQIGNATVNLAFNTDYPVTWSCIGNAISVTVNGATVTGTLTDADMNANAWIRNSSTMGMLSRTGAGVKWSNLTITNVAPTLTVRSGSASGMNSAYSRTNFSAMVPASPDMTIINHGHNEAYQDARQEYLRLADQLLSTFPRTALSATLQNPRAKSDVTYATALARMNSINQLAINEGWGIIDIAAAYFADPSYAVNLLNSDGLHPNLAGSTLWANEVYKALVPSSIVPSRGLSGRSGTIFVPAAYLTAAEGTPTLAPANGWPAWALPHGAGNQSVSGFADVPGSWDQVDIYLLWSTSIASGLTGSTNSAYFEGLMGWLNSRTGYPVGTANAGTAPASTGLQVGAVANNNITYTQQATLVGSGVRPLGRPLLVQGRRLGGHAFDTLVQDVYLHGILIKRAA